MIIGVGTDIVSIDRIKKALPRFGDRFIEKVFTGTEVSYCKGKKEEAEGFAACFAAKEAVLKALGTGVSRGISLKDVEVFRKQGKRPEAKLNGKAKVVADSLGVKNIHLSISHDAGIAVAFAIVEG